MEDDLENMLQCGENTEKTGYKYLQMRTVSKSSSS